MYVSGSHVQADSSATVCDDQQLLHREWPLGTSTSMKSEVPALLFARVRGLKVAETKRCGCCRSTAGGEREWKSIMVCYSTSRP